MIRSPLTLLEDVEAPQARVVGVFYDQSNKLGFKIQHYISKKQIRHLIAAKKLKPLDRPVVAPDLDTLLQFIEREQYGWDFSKNEFKDTGVTLDDIIYYIANGSGAQFLIRNNILHPGGYDSLYKALVTAKYNQVYAKEYDESRAQLVIDPETKQEMLVDPVASRKAIWKARQAFNLMRQNQPEHAGRDFRAAGRGRPEAATHRSEITGQVMVFLLAQIEQLSLQAVSEFVPEELHGIVLVDPTQASDIRSKQFKTISDIDAAQRQEDEKEAARRRKQYQDILKKVNEIRSKLTWMVDSVVASQDQGQPDEFDIGDELEPYYTIYTDVYVKIQPFYDFICRLLNDAFTRKALQLSRNESGFRAVWDTGIESLSVFAAAVDQASFRINRDQSVIPLKDYKKMKQDGFSGPGLLTRILDEAVNVVLSPKFTKKDESGNPVQQFDFSVISVTGPTVVIQFTPR